MKTLNAQTLEQLITQAIAAGDWETVTDLEPRLDAATPPKTLPTILASALWYAEQGLHVFPLQPHTKRPYSGTRGLKEATTNRAQIITWWQRWPHSNVAIATGYLVDVIDVDGPTGVRSWARTEGLPETLGTVATPCWDEKTRQRKHIGGGNHLYIKATGDKNDANMFPGIDYRGLGGYVVAPPSIMPNGMQYTWRRPLQMP